MSWMMDDVREPVKATDARETYDRLMKRLKDEPEAEKPIPEPPPKRLPPIVLKGFPPKVVSPITGEPPFLPSNLSHEPEAKPLLRFPLGVDNAPMTDVWYSEHRDVLYWQSAAHLFKQTREALEAKRARVGFSARELCALDAAYVLRGDGRILPNYLFPDGWDRNLFTHVGVVFAGVNGFTDVWYQPFQDRYMLVCGVESYAEGPRGDLDSLIPADLHYQFDAIYDMLMLHGYDRLSKEAKEEAAVRAAYPPAPVADTLAEYIPDQISKDDWGIPELDNNWFHLIQFEDDEDEVAFQTWMHISGKSLCDFEEDGDPMGGAISPQEFFKNGCGPKYHQSRDRYEYVLANIERAASHFWKDVLSVAAYDAEGEGIRTVQVRAADPAIAVPRGGNLWRIYAPSAYTLTDMTVDLELSAPGYEVLIVPYKFEASDGHILPMISPVMVKEGA